MRTMSWTEYSGISGCEYANVRQCRLRPYDEQCLDVDVAVAHVLFIEVNDEQPADLYAGLLEHHCLECQIRDMVAIFVPFLFRVEQDHVFQWSRNLRN
jgi:hypothetical protein